MNNPEAIQYILDKKKTFIKRGTRVLKNVEKAEDCYQQLLEKFLVSDKFEIEYIPNYTYTAYHRIMSAFAKYEERFYLIGDDGLDLNMEQKSVSTFDSIMGDKILENAQHSDELINYESNKELFMELVNNLPKGQKAAVLRRYSGTHDTKSNTDKAHFRWGFLKLQDMIKEKGYV